MPQQKNPLIEPLKGAGATLLFALFTIFSITGYWGFGCIAPMFICTVAVGVMTGIIFEQAVSRSSFPSMFIEPVQPTRSSPSSRRFGVPEPLD